MILNNNSKRQIGVLFLEALMLVFIVASSCTDMCFNNSRAAGDLILDVVPVEQIVFREGDASAESLLSAISKFTPSPIHSFFHGLDFFSFKLASANSLSNNHYLYNTFYTHLTASAP